MSSSMPAGDPWLGGLRSSVSLPKLLVEAGPQLGRRRACRAPRPGPWTASRTRPDGHHQVEVGEQALRRIGVPAMGEGRSLDHEERQGGRVEGIGGPQQRALEAQVVGAPGLVRLGQTARTARGRARRHRRRRRRPAVRATRCCSASRITRDQTRSVAGAASVTGGAPVRPWAAAARTNGHASGSADAGRSTRRPTGSRPGDVSGSRPMQARNRHARPALARRPCCRAGLYHLGIERGTKRNGRTWIRSRVRMPKLEMAENA